MDHTQFGDSIPSAKRNEIFTILRDGIAPDQFATFARLLISISDNEIKDICDKYRGGTRTLELMNQYEARSNSLDRLLEVLRIMKLFNIIQRIQRLL